MQDATPSRLAFLPNESVEPDQFSRNNFVKLTTPGLFCLDSFLARYLAGDNSLRDSRHISRKRLALAASGLPNMDIQAYELYQQQQRYMQALTLLRQEKNITQEDLCNVNKTLAPESKLSGQIRAGDVFIGKTLKQASYIPPSAMDVPALMDDLLIFINASSSSSLQKAYTAYCQLLAIHPFTDGNGRVARALWQALAPKELSLISPAIYRLSLKNNAHDSALGAFRKTGLDLSSQSFFGKSLSWGENFKQQVQTLLNAAMQSLSQKLALCPLNQTAQHILQYCWQYPVIYPMAFIKQHGLTFEQWQANAQQLVHMGILNIRKVQHPHGTVIYDNPIVMTCYQQLEQLIFSQTPAKESLNTH